MNVSTGQNGTASASTQLTLAQMYIGVGSVDILSNALIFAAVASDKAYRKKAAFVFGLAGGYTTIGMAHLVAGVFRLIHSLNDRVNDDITVWQCMVKMSATFFVMGTVIPAVVLPMMAAERLMALGAPVWYFHSWKPKYNWYAIGCAYTYAVVSTSVPWFRAWFLEYDSVTKILCYTYTVVGMPYTAYCYGVSITGGTLAVTTTLLALAVGLWRLHRAQTTNTTMMRKQISLTQATLTISIMDTALVVIPNLYLYISLTTGIMFPPPFTGDYASAAYCTNATLVIFAHLRFNSEFRTAFFKMLRAVGKLIGAPVKVNNDAVFVIPPGAGSNVK